VNIEYQEDIMAIIWGIYPFLGSHCSYVMGKNSSQNKMAITYLKRDLIVLRHSGSLDRRLVFSRVDMNLGNIKELAMDG
jgi:hypothetical protein